ncbi:MAG TPA: outer membrane protein transport protein [Kofleriaceae bacterium]|nr:outer membrane protein transport protein [Kofleriaceae bacterium]
MTQPSSLLAAALALGVVGSAKAAHAGGILIPGSGAQAQARAGAFVAKADDPSAIAHNPAGFAKIPGTVIYLGSNFVNLSLDYHRSGVYEPHQGGGEAYGYEGQAFSPVSDQSSPAIGFAGFQAIPMIAVSSDLGMPELGLHIGAGVYAPHGYPERDFARDYNFEEPGVPPPPQRYDVMNQKALAILPSLVVAYNILDNLQVGVRGSWGLAQISAETYLWGVRNYVEDVAYDGLFSIDVSDNFVPAFGAGVLYRPLPMLELGAAYNSAMHIDAIGDGRATIGSGVSFDGAVMVEPIDDDHAQCATGGTIDALKTCVSLAIPQTATAGARWILSEGAGERADVEFDAKWENWSADDVSNDLVVVDAKTIAGDLHPAYVRHGFEDVWSFRLGGSYTTPIKDNDLTFRAGAAYDTATAPDDFQRLDKDGAARVTLGAGVSFATGRFRIDLGGGAVLEADRTATGCQTYDTADDKVLSCDGQNAIRPPEQHDSPDPLQPANEADAQLESPFNSGTYSSHYLLFSLAVSAAF